MAIETATSVEQLSLNEKISLINLHRQRIAVARAKQRNVKEEREIQPVAIQSNHRAYIKAYPLRQFTDEAFSIVEQGREYKDNWHIDIICDVLQAALLRDIRNFIINQPRRTMKSTLLCVMLPCYVWTFLPHLRFLFTSYSQDFAKRDNEKCAGLLKSQWYQERWGDKFFLTIDRRAKIANSKGGVRLVFRIGKGTGEGGDWVVADDPNAIDEVESDTILDTTNRGWNEVSYHNVTDRNTAIRAINQQRTAPNDLTGNIAEDLALSKLYVHLCLPMKYETDHPYTNNAKRPVYLGKVSVEDKNTDPSLSLGEEKLWIDPRDTDAPFWENAWYQSWYKKHFYNRGLNSRGENQLLWEGYITEDIIEQEVAHLKAYGESSQFQQRPHPRGGTFFNVTNFKKKPIGEIDLNNLIYIRYWDKAGSNNKGDYTVGTLMARTRTRPFHFYIIDMHRFQLSYYGRMEEMQRIAKEDFENYILGRENCEYTIGIEREGGSSGVDLSTIERDEKLSEYDVWIDTKKVSKESRAKIVKQRSEGGFLFYVANAAWNGIFLKRLERYDPKKKDAKDDEIDTLGGCVYYLGYKLVNQVYSSSGAR